MIDRAMAADCYRLARRLRAIRRAGRSGQELDRLQRDLSDSIALREKRAAGLPTVQLPEELPITSRAEEIAELVREHQVVVVAGETGSGKSTQLPKLMLNIGRGVSGLIGHTQPRRIAARSVAQRVSEELGSPLGQAVGYKVRFTDKTNPETYIKLMTDGVLLAEAARDRYFNAYDTLIIDEAHERSLNIDFLLGHLRQILPQRPDLRIVITSATIDTARFAEHFGVATRQGLEPAPVVEVSGRTYPVEVRYQPIELDDQGEAMDSEEAVAQAIEGLERSGDVLVFMPTERDIRACCDLLERRQPGSVVLPLFARLTNQQQQAIFSGHSKRKIVVATNVAESSLTVPGIRYVVDTGTARISRYSPNSKVQRLPIEAVSRASCDQRKGRCGRIGPGVCIRLYSQADYESRDEFTTPEIMRSNLASVILQVSTLRFGAVEDFPFIDPPRPSMIRDGYKTLHELGALDPSRSKHASTGVTELGRTLARVPVDPRVARMVLAGADEGVLAEVLVIASGLEVQDPRERPMDQRGPADRAHQAFSDERSDFLASLKLWAFYHEQKRRLSNSKLRKACRQNFINDLRMREWIDVHRQLSRMVRELKDVRGSAASVSLDLSEEVSDAKCDAIHRALLTGLLSNVAQKGEGFEYTGSGGQKLHLWPGSSLFERKPKWVVAAELVETTRRYARTVGRIQPGMIEPIAGHLVKKTHSDPRWVAATGSAMCSEKVSLYGLVLVQARPMPLSRVDPHQARQMFIQRALVEGEWDSELNFVKANRELENKIRATQAKVRRAGLLVSDQVRYAFYDQRLPETIVDAASLKKWYGKASDAQRKALVMDESALLAADPAALNEASYPDALEIERSAYRLGYVFDPSDERDGLTLTLPREALGQLDPRRAGWLVPGLVEQKLVALIKSLPKGLRKTLSPAPDAARRAVKAMRFGDGGFEEAAAEALGQVGGLTLSASDFDTSQLPAHLRLNVRVVGAGGKVLAEGRDVLAVRKKLGAGAGPSYAGMDEPRWSGPGVKTWSFGDLPKHVDTTRSGVALRAYPALIDLEADSGGGEGVTLRLVDTRSKARMLSRKGIRRLFSYEVRRDFRWRVDRWPTIDAMRLQFASLGDAKALREQLVLLMTERAFLFDTAAIVDEQGFITRQRVGLQRLDEAEREVRRVAEPVLAGMHRVMLARERSKLAAGHYALSDLRIQCANLFGRSLLVETPWHRLTSIPRYCAAMERRLDKLGNGQGPAASKDAAAFKQVAVHWNRYAKAATAVREAGGYEPELVAYRWLIEEFRVSLFAQELGTAEKVSPQRLDAQWQKVPTT